MYNNRVLQSETSDSKQSIKSTPMKLTNSIQRKSIDNVNNFEKINEKLNIFINKTEENNNNIETELSMMKQHFYDNKSEKEQILSEIQSLKNQFMNFSSKLNQFNKMEIELNRLSIENKKFMNDIQLTKTYLKETLLKNDDEMIDNIKKMIFEIKEPLEEKIKNVSKTISENYDKRSHKLDEILNKLTINKERECFKHQSFENSSEGFEEDRESESDDSESSKEEKEVVDKESLKSKSIIPLSKSNFSAPFKTENSIDSVQTKPSIFTGLNMGSNFSSTFKNDIFSDNKIDVIKSTSLSTNENKPLFGEKSTIFGNSINSTKTSNVKGFYGNSPVVIKNSLFGDNIDSGKTSENKNLFGNSPSAVKTSIFGDTSKTSENKSVFGNFSASMTPSIFGNNINVTKTTTEMTSLFGNLSNSKQSEDNTGIFSTVQPEVKTSILGVKNFETCQSEAKETATPFFGTNSTNQSFVSFAINNKDKEFGIVAETKWQAGPKLFDFKPKEEVEIENEADDHDPEFKPIIELPPLVKVVKDDDNKEVLFKHRCKLYRFDNEWKERGVGEIKILKSIIDGSVTLMMRREMVHKLCCNQLVTKDSHKFASMGSDKSTCWPGTDFSEGKSVLEKFAVKFSDKNILDDFKRTISDVQAAL